MTRICFTNMLFNFYIHLVAFVQICCTLRRALNACAHYGIALRIDQCRYFRVVLTTHVQMLHDWNTRQYILCWSGTPSSYLKIYILSTGKITLTFKTSISTSCSWPKGKAVGFEHRGLWVQSPMWTIIFHFEIFSCFEFLATWLNLY